MKCYFHPEIDAVAICKSCSKGICSGCAVDVGNGMACKNKCENRVKSLNALVERSEASYSTANQSFQTTGIIYKNLAIWLLLIGGAFSIFGIIQSLFFLIVLGIFFIIGSIFSFTEAKRFKKLKV